MQNLKSDGKDTVTEKSGEPIVAHSSGNQEDKTRNRKCQQVEQFCCTTTCHGLIHIANREDHLYFRISWAIIVIVFAVLSIKTVYYSAAELSKFKLSSEFFEQVDEGIIDGMVLPDIHICDSSIFNATRLKAMGFNSTMATYLTLSTSDNAAVEYLLNDLDKQKALKEEFDRILSSNFWTLNEVVELASIKCVDMLMGCTKAGKWYSATNCCAEFFNEKQYVSIFGSCISTHGKTIRQEYASRDAGFIVYAIPNARHIINFDNTLIKAEYILQEGLYYAVSSRTAHIEFTLHTEGRFAWPNSWVSLPITKSVVDNTELKNNYLAPFSCIDSTDPLQRKLRAPDYNYYSELNCITSIYQRNYRRFYNCSAIFSSYGNDTNFCDPSQIVSANLTLVILDAPIESGTDTCPLECIKESYSLSPSYAEINKGLLLNKYDSAKTLKTSLERDPVVLHFFYTTFSYQVRKSYTTTFTNFLGEVGGNLGLFLGVSLITMVEFLILCIRCIAA